MKGQSLDEPHRYPPVIGYGQTMERNFGVIACAMSSARPPDL